MRVITGDVRLLLLLVSCLACRACCILVSDEALAVEAVCGRQGGVVAEEKDRCQPEEKLVKRAIAEEDSAGKPGSRRILRTKEIAKEKNFFRQKGRSHLGKTLHKANKSCSGKTRDILTSVKDKANKSYHSDYASGDYAIESADYDYNEPVDHSGGPTPEPDDLGNFTSVQEAAERKCKSERISDRCFIGCLLEALRKGPTFLNGSRDGMLTGYVYKRSMCPYPYPFGMPGTPADPQGDSMKIPDLKVLRGTDVYPHKDGVFYVCMSKRMEDEKGLLHDFHMWAIDSDLNVYQTNSEGKSLTFGEIGNVTLDADKHIEMQYFNTGHDKERARSANYYMGSVVFCKEYTDKEGGD